MSVTLVVFSLYLHVTDQLCSLQELSLVQAPHCPPPSTCTSLTGTKRDPTLTGSPTPHHNGTSDITEEPVASHDRECDLHNGDQQCVLDTNCRGTRDGNDCSICRVHGHSGTTCPACGRGRKTGASYLRQQWARWTQPQLQVTDSPPSSEEERHQVSVEEEDGMKGSGKEGFSNEQSCAPDADKLSPPDPNCSSEGTLNRMPACSQPRRQLLKAQSVGSISSESLTVSSLWEAPSYDTIPDFLSSLGFDDFDSPELIPDRFIPPELDFVRPSLMRQATLGSVSTDSHLVEPLTPPDGTAATEDEEDHVPPQTLAIYLSSNSQLTWQPASLETVVEETGNEVLSPRPSSRLSAQMTPRLTSPLLSIDHTPTHDMPVGIEGDVSAGLLGAGLAQRLRMQVFAKEDLRQRQMSLGGESDTSSLYFSVGSHFEEGEGETGSAPANRAGEAASTDDTSETTASTRRRRRGNYAPPPQLLLWLESAESSVDKEDQPWPFSESPTGQSPSPSPSNSNTNNNCQHESNLRPLTAVSHQRECVEIKGPVQAQELNDAVADLKLRDISNCLSSAYHRSSHPPHSIG